MTTGSPAYALYSGVYGSPPQLVASFSHASAHGRSASGSARRFIVESIGSGSWLVMSHSTNSRYDLSTRPGMRTHALRASAEAPWPAPGGTHVGSVRMSARAPARISCPETGSYHFEPLGSTMIW